MALSKTEISQLKELTKENGWDVLMKYLGQYIEETNGIEINGQNAFETLRMLHTNQGKVSGVTEFFDRLERKAFE